MLTISGFPLPLGFELYLANSRGIELITVPGRLDIFELRSLNGIRETLEAWLPITSS